MFSIPHHSFAFIVNFFFFEFCFIYFFKIYLRRIILEDVTSLGINFVCFQFFKNCPLSPSLFPFIMKDWIFQLDSMNFIPTVWISILFIFFFFSQRFLNCIIRMLAVRLFDSSTTHNHFLNCGGRGRREGEDMKKIKRIERTPGDCGISMEALKRRSLSRDQRAWIARRARRSIALNGGQIVNVDRKMEGGHFAGNRSSLIARDNRS